MTTRAEKPLTAGQKQMVAALTEAFETFTATGSLDGYRKSYSLPYYNLMIRSLVKAGVIEVVDSVETKPNCFCHIFYVHTSKIPA